MPATSNCKGIYNIKWLEGVIGLFVFINKVICVFAYTVWIVEVIEIRAGLSYLAIISKPMTLPSRSTRKLLIL